VFFFFQAEDGIRDLYVTGVQTCALPICSGEESRSENQSESISVLSQRSMSRQKSSRPAGPAAQGPGMTPIRYLTCGAMALASPGPGPVQGEVHRLLGDELEKRGHALLGLPDRPLDRRDDLAGLRHPLAVA